MRSRLSALFVATLLPVADLTAGLTVEKVSEVMRSDPSRAGEASGITWAGGDLYYVVDDSDGMIYPASIEIDRATGAVLTNAIGCGVSVVGAMDMEGCAFDAATGRVWVSDEGTYHTRDTFASIREIDPTTGAVFRTVVIPAPLLDYRTNFGFEALTLSGDALTLWTANEEALECDGENSSGDTGSVVRLARFTRASVHDDWMADGQWPYLTDPVGSNPWRYGGETKTRSGVAGLCALPDGTLIVLERNLRGENLWNATFHTRLYAVVPREFAPDRNVSGVASLRDTPRPPVAKTSLFDRNVGWVNYEGICLGPTLDDGSAVLVLISDGGSSTAKQIMTFRLAGIGQPSSL